MLSLRLAWVGYAATRDAASGDMPTMSIVCPCERRLILLQWFVWNIACETSLIVALIFWVGLVSMCGCAPSGLGGNFLIGALSVLSILSVLSVSSRRESVRH